MRQHIRGAGSEDRRHARLRSRWQGFESHHRGDFLSGLNVSSANGHKEKTEPPVAPLAVQRA